MTLLEGRAMIYRSIKLCRPPRFYASAIMPGRDRSFPSRIGRTLLKRSRRRRRRPDPVLWMGRLRGQIGWDVVYGYDGGACGLWMEDRPAQEDLASNFSIG